MVASATATAAFQSVETLFHQQIARDVHPGAQLAVYHQGKLVLDVWGGLADTQRGKKVERDTASIIGSATWLS